MRLFFLLCSLSVFVLSTAPPTGDDDKVTQLLRELNIDGKVPLDDVSLALTSNFLFTAKGLVEYLKHEEGSITVDGIRNMGIQKFGVRNLLCAALVTYDHNSTSGAGSTGGDVPANQALTMELMRQEKWYSRYLQTVTNSLEEANRKKPDARIKVLGIQPNNHEEYGARTRIEFNAIEMDILKALRTHAVNKIKEPEMMRIKFEYLQSEIDAANNSDGKIHLIIASCPSQLGDDKTIMEQVTAMIGTSTAVDKCYSQAGNVASVIFGGM